jgi:hypothetical protein
VLLVGTYAQLIGRVRFEAVTAAFLLVTFTYVRIGGPVKVFLATVAATLLASVVIPWIFTMPLP